MRGIDCHNYLVFKGEEGRGGDDKTSKNMYIRSQKIFFFLKKKKKTSNVSNTKLAG